MNNDSKQIDLDDVFRFKTYYRGQTVYCRIYIPYQLANAVFSFSDKVYVAMSANGLVGIAVNNKIGVKPEYRNSHVRITSRLNKIKVAKNDPEFNIASGQESCITNGNYGQGVITFKVPDHFYSITDMNKSQKSAIGNLTGQMLKVYNVMPLKKPWHISEIVAELARTGHNIEHRTVLGCARALAERGLITEKPQFSFMRIHAEATPPMTPHKPPTLEIVKMPAPEKKRGPMELLADLAAKARLFANELDNAALEIEQDFQTSEAQSKKLKQLQSLLKDIAE